MLTTTKKCTSCKIPKSLDSFAKKGKGFQSVCKDCKNEYTRIHYQENKEYYIEKRARQKHDSKQWLQDLKSNLKCNRCVEDHIACLQFHHKDPNQKEITITQAVASGWSKNRIRDEMAKCEVLCANCHAKEHHLNVSPQNQ